MRRPFVPELHERVRSIPEIGAGLCGSGGGLIQQGQADLTLGYHSNAYRSIERLRSALFLNKAFDIRDRLLSKG